MLDLNIRRSEPRRKARFASITIPKNMKISAILILNFFIGLVVCNISHKKNVVLPLHSTKVSRDITRDG